MKNKNRKLKIYQPDTDSRRYLVSDCGRMIALEHTGKDGRTLRPRNVSLTLRPDGYVQLSINGFNMLMHRIIAECFIPNPECKPQVDHINGDKADNRASNLRWATNKENMKGFQIKRKGATSKYRGVNWHNKKKKWHSRFQLENGIQKHVGYFDDEEEAAWLRPLIIGEVGAGVGTLLVFGRLKDIRPILVVELVVASYTYVYMYEMRYYQGY